MTFQDALKDIKARGAKVLVVGLGISGIETASFLSRSGIKAVCAEKESEDAYLKKSKYNGRIQELRAKGVELSFAIDGEKVASLLEGVELCVVSPGVSLESAIVGALKRRGLRLVSEHELGIELMGWPAIVVTGSNGKSTTVSLVHHMLKTAGFNSMLCGNVGVPVIAGLDPEMLDHGEAPPRGVLVVEASSYQLESCSILKPKVAALLNISDNHLERHGTINRYFEIKCKAFANQDASDFAILNSDDPKTRSLCGTLKARNCLFGQGAPAGSYSARVAYEPPGSDQVRLQLAEGEEIYECGASRLLGRHNRQNIAAAALMARVMGAPREAIQSSIETFKPLEHRLKFAREIEGVVYINDSKSTTVAATLAAASSILDAFPDRALRLMIGGLSKAGSWQPLMELLKRAADRLRPVICFGRDSNILSNHCRASGVPFQVAPSMTEACRMARGEAKPGELVLLSPGCASFDEFTDFEDRGNVFKSLLQQSS